MSEVHEAVPDERLQGSKRHGSPGSQNEPPPSKIRKIDDSVCAREALQELLQLGLTYEEIVQASQVNRAILTELYRALGYRVPSSAVDMKSGYSISPLSPTAPLAAVGASYVEGSSMSFPSAIDVAAKPVTISQRILPTFGADRWSTQMTIELSDESEEESENESTAPEATSSTPVDLYTKLMSECSALQNDIYVTMAARRKLINGIANSIQDTRLISAFLEIQRTISLLEEKRQKLGQHLSQKAADKMHAERYSILSHSIMENEERLAKIFDSWPSVQKLTVKIKDLWHTISLKRMKLNVASSLQLKSRQPSPQPSGLDDATMSLSPRQQELAKLRQKLMAKSPSSVDSVENPSNQEIAITQEDEMKYPTVKWNTPTSADTETMFSVDDCDSSSGSSSQISATNGGTKTIESLSSKMSPETRTGTTGDSTPAINQQALLAGPKRRAGPQISLVSENEGASNSIYTELEKKSHSLGEMNGMDSQLIQSNRDSFATDTNSEIESESICSTKSADTSIQHFVESHPDKLENSSGYVSFPCAGSEILSFTSQSPLTERETLPTKISNCQAEEFDKGEFDQDLLRIEHNKAGSLHSPVGERKDYGHDLTFHSPLAAFKSYIFSPLYKFAYNSPTYTIKDEIIDKEICMQHATGAEGCPALHLLSADLNLDDQQQLLFITRHATEGATSKATSKNRKEFTKELLQLGENPSFEQVANLGIQYKKNKCKALKHPRFL